MARQAIASGPTPVYVNETTSKEMIAVAPVYVNETITSPPPPPPPPTAGVNVFSVSSPIVARRVTVNAY